MAKTQEVVFSFDERKLGKPAKDQGPGPVLVDGRGCARFPAESAVLCSRRQPQGFSEIVVRNPETKEEAGNWWCRLCTRRKGEN